LAHFISVVWLYGLFLFLGSEVFSGIDIILMDIVGYCDSMGSLSPWSSWLCFPCCSSNLLDLATPYTPRRPYTAASDTTTSVLLLKLCRQRERDEEESQQDESHSVW